MWKLPLKWIWLSDLDLEPSAELGNPSRSKPSGLCFNPVRIVYCYQKSFLDFFWTNPENVVSLPFSHQDTGGFPFNLWRKKTTDADHLMGEKLGWRKVDVPHYLGPMRTYIDPVYHFDSFDTQSKKTTVLPPTFFFKNKCVRWWCFLFFWLVVIENSSSIAVDRFARLFGLHVNLASPHFHSNWAHDSPTNNATLSDCYPAR
jgi:hypothetical protein